MPDNTLPLMVDLDVHRALVEVYRAAVKVDAAYEFPTQQEAVAALKDVLRWYRDLIDSHTVTDIGPWEQRHDDTLRHGAALDRRDEAVA